MSIWEYETNSDWKADENTFYQTKCLYCRAPLVRDLVNEFSVAVNEELRDFTLNDRTRVFIGICPACGWWKCAMGSYYSDAKPCYDLKLAVLRRLDLSCLKIPINEVRDYLVARYEERYNVHPRVFEEVVADVFRNHGYRANVTAYSGDGGIDVILEDDEGNSTGVQVKRYKDRISVSQIRELTGALVIGGHTKGIFVTTSEFQSGALTTAAMSEIRGYPIELIDASQFYDVLKIAQLSTMREVIYRKPWGNISDGMSWRT